MTRTQIYLDEDQKAALRLLAADRDVTVSDIVREAVDRLLAIELSGVEFAPRLEAVLKRIQDRVGDVSEDQVEAAFRRARARKKHILA